MRSERCISKAKKVNPGLGVSYPEIDWDFTGDVSQISPETLTSALREGPGLLIPIRIDVNGVLLLDPSPCAFVSAMLISSAQSRSVAQPRSAPFGKEDDLPPVIDGGATASCC
jgi:hypothetical protein